jgi:hypothetical protein
MTTRQWMVTVAAVAALLAVEATRRRWAERAAECQKTAMFHRVLANVYRSGAHLGSRVEDPDETSRKVAHQLRLVDKYDRAARRPWLPVPPDPPEPE